jgi:hypothetical protein
LPLYDKGPPARVRWIVDFRSFDSGGNKKYSAERLYSIRPFTMR